MKTALAIVAHPDDIEFRMAGTLLLLRRAGWEIHCMTIANGSLGSMEYTAAQTRRIRRAESRKATEILGAHWHASLVDDMQIVYDMKLVKRLCAVVREVRASIVMTHPPQDYMEDHTNTCRLAVSAAFIRGAPNFVTVPRRPAYGEDVAVYHCVPHGMCDQLRRPLTPELFVNTTAVMETKSKALAAHQSQVKWLEASQGLGAFVEQMKVDAAVQGKMSRKFKYAEGWWRHLHLGFSTTDSDPLREVLGRDCVVNPAYVQMLKRGN